MKLTRRQQRQIRKQNKITGGFANLADMRIGESEGIDDKKVFSSNTKMAFSSGVQA